MLKISRVVIISILIVTQWPVWGQNNTNSPYTRFGYGELANRSFGAGRAMGGIGIGLRSSKQINPMNPASYSSTDSMTFIFDFGAAMQLSWFDDGINKQDDINGNFEYAALQFPVTRWLAVSAGFLPFSYVGYDFGAYHGEGDNPYTEQFLGKGGLNEVYLGLSIDIWKKRLSVGANVGYMFGTINHQRNVQFASSSSAVNNVLNAQELKVKDVKLDFGLQYSHPIQRDQRFILGLVYSPANSLNNKAYNKVDIRPSPSLSSATIDTLKNAKFDIPHSFGAGISYVKDDKLTVAVDVLMEKWSDSFFFDKSDQFKDLFRVGGGVEYIPNYNYRNFFQRVRYRAGLHYSNSYHNITSVTDNGKTGFGYDEYGASLGFGFPLIDNRSYVNVTFEYVKIKPETKLMIDEQYFRFSLNFTFNERWFYKLKLN